ncbi:DUF805 domain-containing protein [Longispora urticae]
MIRNYVGFSGRARRKEYWMFTLIHTVIALALSVLGANIGSDLPYYAYVLPTFLPALAVTVRRLHDTGRSGWWVLLALVPFVGIVVIVLLALDGERHPNIYGEDPKRDEVFA